MRHFQPPRVWFSAAIAFVALVVSGCAGLRLPRIDPTGERVFVAAQNQVPPVGNPLAPPVFTDPVFPQPALTNAAPVLAAPGLAAAPVGVAIPPIPQDTLSITPERILAPVGSEVILKAGVCMPSQYLLTDTKIEWLIARESAGEFVSLGGRGYLRKALLPWNQPQKVDNQYAVGYSAKVPLRITRGTANPADDVQIEPGEAWASITSPIEGVSHITAVAPEIEAWNGRRASATIYWVDVLWTFPPSAVTAGGSQVLSTMVRRQTDGTPLAGWLVRYEVVDSGAPQDDRSRQVVEVATDAEGRASIDVTPTGGAGTTSQIGIQLVRPRNSGGTSAPRLVVAHGTTTIRWTGNDYLPPAGNFGNQTPTENNSTTPFVPTPAPPTFTSQPSLELEIRDNNTGIAVGGQARFEVIVHNRGNAPATDVVLTDSFDPGFRHLGDQYGTHEIRKPLAPTLAAGQSLTDYISFEVVRDGQLCHEVTVTCNEGSQAQKRACINVLAAPPQKRIGLTVTKNGPRQHSVGETALFTLSIKNDGEVPLTNLEVIDEYDPEFRARPVKEGYRLVNDRIVWAIPRLEVGDTIQLDVECQCLAPSAKACSTVQVSADTGTAAGVISKADNHCMEILPARNAVSQSDALPGSNLSTDDLLPATGTLQLSISALSGDTVQTGTVVRYEIVVRNPISTPDNDVQLSITFPPGMTPDVDNAPNNAFVRATVQGNVLRFDKILEIHGVERLKFDVQATASRPGVGRVAAQVTSRRLVQPLQKSVPVEMIH